MISTTFDLSPRRLSIRCALVLVAAACVASAVGLIALGPIASTVWPGGPDAGPLQGVAATASAHEEASSGAWRVLAALPLLLAALYGAAVARRSAIDAVLRRAWRVFFGWGVLAGLAILLGAGWGVQLPTLLLTLPIASACAVLCLIVLAERIGPRWAVPARLLSASLAGPLAAALGLAAQLSNGLPDERALLWVQCLPLLLLPLGLWNLRSRGLSGAEWSVALGAYGVAAWALRESTLARLAGDAALGSMALAPLALAACVGWLAWRLSRQGSRARRANTAASTAG